MQFLAAHDLDGPARTLLSNGVRGKDLVALTANELVLDLKLSQFTAARVLEARDAFLGSA